MLPIVIFVYLYLCVILFSFSSSYAFKLSKAPISFHRRWMAPISIVDPPITSDEFYSKEWKGPSPLWNEPIMVDHACNLIKTYASFTGKEIYPLNKLEGNEEEAAKKLFLHNDLIVLSHGIQDGPDGPLLNYGNLEALKRWKTTWEELTTLHSSYTTESLDRDERAKIMDKVKRDGCIDHYSGIRIDKQGKKFRIMDTLIWNIVVDDVLVGQAACFKKFELID